MISIEEHLQHVLRHVRRVTAPGNAMVDGALQVFKQALLAFLCDATDQAAAYLPRDGGKHEIQMEKSSSEHQVFWQRLLCNLVTPRGAVRSLGCFFYPLLLVTLAKRSW